ncbi:MAG TPA: hypothetical protein VNA16_10600, partial [Abditibacteriaceae bacterium]|nr:hypothetical protein [Abditibacteriaceae bacterium]
MPQWTKLFDLPLPGWTPVRLAATGEAAIVLARGRLLDEGSGSAPWPTFDLRLICYDLANRTPHWEYSLQGPDTMWQLHIGHDAVLLWDDMGSGAWLHNLPDGARRELPSKLHNGETLTLSLESVWRYDGGSVEVLELATAKVRGSWRCKAWRPTAARVADGLCWLACVAERNSEDHALLCIDPGQRRSTLITELPLVENLTDLVVTPDLVVLLGRTPAAAEVELPAA